VSEREPSATTPEQLAAAENTRMIKRREVRSRIAAADLAEQRRSEIVGTMATIDERKESLAAEHVETCAPLQAELAEIEKQQIAAITNRAPTDTAIEGRRKELLDRLRGLNASLEESIEREDRLLTALEADRLAAAKQCGTSILQHELFQLASPDLAEAMTVARYAVEWAERRLQAATDRAAQFPHNPVWKAEYKAAAAEVNRTKQLADAATSAVLNE